MCLSPGSVLIGGLLWPDAAITSDPVTLFVSAAAIVGLLWLVVSKRRREEERAERHRFQRNLVDSHVDAVICIRRDGIITEFNDASSELLGYSRDEVLGEPGTFLIHADDAPALVAGFQDHFDSPGRSQHPRGQAVEVVAVAKSGERIPVSMVVSFVQGTTEPTVLATLRDLRPERKHRRIADYLKATFESVDEGVTIYDEQYRLVAWNQRYEELDTGIDPKFLVYGASLFDLYRDSATRGVFGPGDPDEIAHSRIDAIRTGPLIPTENLSPTSGTIVRINRFRLPGGGICATFRDVTEERKLEAELRHSQKMEAVGRLAGGVAHDLNNMLTVILGCTELMLMETASAALAEKLQAVMDAATCGSEVTHRMLALSRKQPLMPEPVEFGELLNSLSTLLQSTLGEQVHMTIATESKLWECDVDRPQLESTLINLAANARDALRGQSGELHFRASNKSLNASSAKELGIAAGDYVQLTVTDTGSGIPPEVLSQVFEPFYTTKSPGEGTGLGLSMAHGFVTQSKGAISIDSNSSGTEVRILLPRCDGQSSRGVDTPGVSGAQEHTSGKVILLVEDERGVREMIAGQLRAEGFTVIAVEDGNAALCIFESSQELDVVLTDLRLPGAYDGQQVAEMAKAHYPDVPVVFMSGYYEESIGRIGNAGSTVLLAKPFGVKKLSEAIQKALRDAHQAH